MKIEDSPAPGFTTNGYRLSAIDCRLWPILFAILAVVFLTGCQDFGFPTPPTTGTPPARTAGRTTLVISEDRAILAVQEYLLNKAASARAKTYLTDLYASGAAWTGKSELLKDGTRIFNVTLTTSKSGTQVREHWRQALWTVFDDGKVLPSSTYDGNALRIEADIQALN
ncbi:MAG: hypothetical protein HY673_09805 [Chloroflexi bacterium]|nr:hypothetical protein [Chloroflexota bacterium]